MAKVTIALSQVQPPSFPGGMPGDQFEVEEDEARRLVNDGTAQYATVPDAKKAGDEPEKAATKSSK